MATPAPPPHRPLGFSYLLVLAACIVCAVLAILILFTSTTIVVLTALGWLAIALALYFGSLLVP